MRVFRIEDESRRGPYVGHCGKRADKEELAWDLCMAHSSSHSHPGADKDVIGYSQGWHCGFANLEQYKNWFKGFTRKLAKAGYSLVELEISEEKVLIGDFQVAFSREDATIIASHSPNYGVL